MLKGVEDFVAVIAKVVILALPALTDAANVIVLRGYRN
jgi:hypothetical protein